MTRFKEEKWSDVVLVAGTVLARPFKFDVDRKFSLCCCLMPKILAGIQKNISWPFFRWKLQRTVLNFLDEMFGWLALYVCCWKMLSCDVSCLNIRCGHWALKFTILRCPWRVVCLVLSVCMSQVISKRRIIWFRKVHRSCLMVGIGLVLHSC